MSSRHLFCFLILTALTAPRTALVEAAQIAPNPNTGTIDIINDPSAFNSDNPFINIGTINIDSLSTLTNNTGALINNGDTTTFSAGTLTNNGTLINNGGVAVDFSSTLTNNGTVINNGGLGSGFNSGSGTITNNGTLINNGFAGTNNNGGLINNGTLTNNGSMTSFAPNGCCAPITNAIGATLNNYGSIDIRGPGVGGSGQLTNAGTINNFAGATLNSPGSWANTGTVNNFTGATLFLVGEFTTVLNAAGATVNNYGAMSTGTASLFPMVNNGTVNNSGFWGVSVGGISNSIGAMLNNSGTITLFFPILQNAGTLINSGSISGQAQGFPYNLSNSGIVINTGLIGGASVSNGGILLNTGSMDALASYIQGAGQTINNGTMSVAIGSQFTMNGGTLSGTGTINAPVTLGSGALLSPGNSNNLGTLTINGNLQSSGNLRFGFTGLNVGQFGQLAINGTATFTGGTMSFNFLNFVPKIGDSWDFLLASAISGWDTLTFAFTGLGDHEKAQFSFHNGIETLRIVAVPEPSSLLLLGAGLVGIVGFRRKR